MTHAASAADGNHTGPEQRYLDYLGQGRFMLQRVRTSGEYVFYPRIAAPGSGDENLEWVAASGDGTVYATTVVRQRPEAGPDYNVALIDLAEGPRLMSRVVDIAPEQVRIGMPVRARIDLTGDEPLLVFTAAENDDER